MKRSVSSSAIPGAMWGRASGVDLRIGGAIVLLAVALRAYYATRYPGWDMEDMESSTWARLLIEKGWRALPVEFGPLYYVLQAMLTALVGDGWWAGRILSLVGGGASVALTYSLGLRVFGRPTAVLASLLLAIQTHSVLLSATTLREPVYAAFLLWMTLALVQRRYRMAAVVACLCFLTRQEGLTGAMVGLCACLPLPDRRRRRVVADSFAIMCGVLFAWSIYSRALHGEWWWENAIRANVFSGEAVYTFQDKVEWAKALFVSFLPFRVGHGVWFGVAILAASSLWQPRRNSWPVWAVFLTSFLTWLGTILTSILEPGHDLHWKRHAVFEPHVLLLGSAGVMTLAEWVRGSAGHGWATGQFRSPGAPAAARRALAWALVVGMFGHQIWLYQQRTTFLMQRSAQGLGWVQRTYDWLEAEFPDEPRIAVTRPVYWYTSRWPQGRYWDVMDADIHDGLMNLLEREEIALFALSEESMLKRFFLTWDEIPREGEDVRWGHGHLQLEARLDGRPHVWVIRYVWEDGAELVQPQGEIRSEKPSIFD